MLNLKVKTLPKKNYANSGRNPAITRLEIEKADSKDEFSCLKWTIYNGMRKVCINFQTDTDEVNIVVYRYPNITYLKDTGMDLKLTEYKKFRAKRVYLLSYNDIFYKRCNALDETTVHNYDKLCQERMFFKLEFPDCTRD